jgi:hypothetical protein
VKAQEIREAAKVHDENENEYARKNQQRGCQNLRMGSIGAVDVMAAML